MGHIQLKKIILALIILFGAFLIFFRLTRADFQTDGAFYSMWSVGYLDFLFSDQQSTPIQWFGYVPWWANLSFHAHPPLVFFIQHIFFKFFQDSEFIALLPFALAGVGSLIMLYFIAKRLYDGNTAILATFILSISTFFTWMSRINYLEAVEMFFILATLLFLIKAVENERYYVHFGVFLGLSFLTKYTSFFLIPLSFLYIFWNGVSRKIRIKEIFLNRHLLISTCIAVVIFLPVVYYNIMLYKTRGHFDVQFSSLFSSTRESAKKDWPIIYTDWQVWRPIENFSSIFPTLKRSYSPPFFYFIVAAFIFLLIKLLTRKDTSNIFIFASVISLVIIFTIIPPSGRYLPLWTPFLALIAAACIREIHKMMFARDITIGSFVIKIDARYFLYFIIAIIFCYEIFFNINTNHAYRAKGREGAQYASYRVENFGFNELGKYLKSTWENDRLYMKDIKNIVQRKDYLLSEGDLGDSNVYFYERGLNWFATMWYFKRQRLFHNVIISPDLDFFKSLKEKENPEKWIEWLKSKKANNIFFIKGVDSTVYDYAYSQDQNAQQLSNYIETILKKSLEEKKNVEIKKIFNINGVEAFRVYKLKLN